MTTRKDHALVRIGMVLSTSASGKTYYVENSGDRRVFDGDAAIARSIGWPSEKAWYERADKEVAAIHYEHEVAIRTWAACSGLIALFNGAIRDYRNVVVALVEVSDDVLVDRMNARILEKDRGKYQPTMADVLHNRDALRRMVPSDTPIYRTFTAAIDAVTRGLRR